MSRKDLLSELSNLINIRNYVYNTMNSTINLNFSINKKELSKRLGDLDSEILGRLSELELEGSGVE